MEIQLPLEFALWFSGLAATGVTKFPRSPSPRNTMLSKLAEQHLQKRSLQRNICCAGGSAEAIPPPHSTSSLARLFFKQLTHPTHLPASINTRHRDESRMRGPAFTTYGVSELSWLERGRLIIVRCPRFQPVWDHFHQGRHIRRNSIMRSPGEALLRMMPASTWLRWFFPSGRIQMPTIIIQRIWKDMVRCHGA